MTRTFVFLAALLIAGSAQAQMECRTDPQSPDLEFVPQVGGRTLEFRGKRPDRGLARSCVLTLDCTLRGQPNTVDYLIIPLRAGDPPAVWNIRRVYFKYLEGGEQSCVVTATSDPRPPLAVPPPFVRRPKNH